jgi:hypothetical protein
MFNIIRKEEPLCVGDRNEKICQEPIRSYAQQYEQFFSFTTWFRGTLNQDGATEINWPQTADGKGKSFKFLEQWKFIKDSPKWQSLTGKNVKKRNKPDEDLSVASTDATAEELKPSQRPMGNKVAKRMKKAALRTEEEIDNQLKSIEHKFLDLIQQKTKAIEMPNMINCFCMHFESQASKDFFAYYSEQMLNNLGTRRITVPVPLTSSVAPLGSPCSSPVLIDENQIKHT